jgi:hypothetical protein
MAEPEKSTTLRTALIGLIGTLLTVCGGLGGAVITSAVTVYQVQRQNEKIDLPASSGEKTLQVDTGTIFLTRQEAATLDAGKYYVNLEQAFVLPRPLPGWSEMEEMTVKEQLAEQNIDCQVLCDQPVYRIRYGDPIEVESDRNTTINGQLIPADLLDLYERFYGPPPWKFPSYSQVIVNIFAKDQEEALGIHSLPDMMLMVTRYMNSRINRVVATEGSHFALVQTSTTSANIRLNGVAGSLTTDDWMLFSETDTAYYSVEIAYIPQSGQSVEVWDDLQTYINQFRVVR